jgi:hypothetical protein
MLCIYYTVGIRVENKEASEEQPQKVVGVPFTVELEFLGSICRGLKVSLWVELNPLHATHINFI